MQKTNATPRQMTTNGRIILPSCFPKTEEGKHQTGRCRVAPIDRNVGILLGPGGGGYSPFARFARLLKAQARRRANPFDALCSGMHRGTTLKNHTAYSVLTHCRALQMLFAKSVRIEPLGAMCEKPLILPCFFARPDAQRATREGARFRPVPLCPLCGCAVAAFEFFAAAAWA
jgi:hypothetical protein